MCVCVCVCVCVGLFIIKNERQGRLVHVRQIFQCVSSSFPFTDKTGMEFFDGLTKFSGCLLSSVCFSAQRNVMPSAKSGKPFILHFKFINIVWVKFLHDVFSLAVEPPSLHAFTDRSHFREFCI